MQTNAARLTESNTTRDCQQVPVERALGLTPEIFYERYLTGTGRPVIVTDELNTWKARSNWSFDFFKSRYGSETVVPAIWPGDKYMKLMRLEDYIAYIQTPSERLPGIWIDPETKFPRPEPSEPISGPLYLYGWRGFDLHPELLDDVEQSPKCVEDWLCLFPAALRKVMNETTGYFSRGILLGPAGSKSHLHQDFLNSHAYLAQIAGRKRCTLFAPEDSASLYSGRVDPDLPDLDQFPLFRNATAFECTLEPGEMLFIPSLWWHHVVALENSITVNYNFLNRVNFAAYLRELLQRLPDIVAGIEKLPEAKVALGINWLCKGFEFPNRSHEG